MRKLEEFAQIRQQALRRKPDIVAHDQIAKRVDDEQSMFAVLLRERRDDIPLLVTQFFERFAPGAGLRLSQSAMRALMDYAWPGNVRQLENVIERAVALSAGRKELSIADLPEEFRTEQPAAPPTPVTLPDDGLDLQAYLASIERELIRSSLERTRGNRNKAAELLRLKRTTLVEKIRRLTP